MMLSTTLVSYYILLILLSILLTEILISSFCMTLSIPLIIVLLLVDVQPVGDESGLIDIHTVIYISPARANSVN
jgi:hypothetical protein